MIKLWHGSRTGLEGAIRPASITDGDGEYVPHDFGVGFYAYFNRDSVRVQQPHSAVLTEIDFRGLDALKGCGCRVHIFTHDMDGILEWALYVAYHRNFFRQPLPIREGGGIARKPAAELYPLTLAHVAGLDGYDVVIGPAADGLMQYVYEKFIDGWLGIRVLGEAVESASLGMQAAFKTQKACDALNAHSRVSAHGAPWSFMQAVRDAALKETDIRDRTTLSNRKYLHSGGERYIGDLLPEMENRLRTDKSPALPTS